MRLILAIAVGATIATAGPGADPAAGQDRVRPFETTEEARQRHGAQRWDDYESRGRMPPLGGYKETLGDPAPPGTPEPGFVAPRPADADAEGERRLPLPPVIPAKAGIQAEPGPGLPPSRE